MGWVPPRRGGSITFDDPADAFEDDGTRLLSEDNRARSGGFSKDEDEYANTGALPQDQGQPHTRALQGGQEGDTREFIDESSTELSDTGGREQGGVFWIPADARDLSFPRPEPDVASADLAWSVAAQSAELARSGSASARDFGYPRPSSDGPGGHHEGDSVHIADSLDSGDEGEVPVPNHVSEHAGERTNGQVSVGSLDGPSVPAGGDGLQHHRRHLLRRASEDGLVSDDVLWWLGDGPTGAGAPLPGPRIPVGPQTLAAVGPQLRPPSRSSSSGGGSSGSAKGASGLQEGPVSKQVAAAGAAAGGRGDRNRAPPSQESGSRESSSRRSQQRELQARLREQVALLHASARDQGSLPGAGSTTGARARERGRRAEGGGSSRGAPARATVMGASMVDHVALPEGVAAHQMRPEGGAGYSSGGDGVQHALMMREPVAMLQPVGGGGHLASPLAVMLPVVLAVMWVAGLMRALGRARDERQGAKGAIRRGPWVDGRRG
eukprot:jgi/Mesvir1/6266/Mv19975-RA.1